MKPLSLMTATLLLFFGAPKSQALEADSYFNSYILKAVQQINATQRLKGYDINAVLTHDISYGSIGVIRATRAPRTMCVAAQMEIILTAMQLYARDQGSERVFKYLPERSWEKLSIKDFKGHLWVNPDFNAHGAADAMVSFGMGEYTPFEKLKPGAFVNINRTSGSGHAVVFINYIDKYGRDLGSYDSSVVGFKYYSSQGLYEAGFGGMDYRWAVFNQYGCPDMPGKKRDCGIIYSKKQNILNTGTMWSPDRWQKRRADQMQMLGDDGIETLFDAQRFNGLTTDDF